MSLQILEVDTSININNSNNVKLVKHQRGSYTTHIKFPRRTIGGSFTINLHFDDILIKASAATRSMNRVQYKKWAPPQTKV